MGKNKKWSEDRIPIAVADAVPNLKRVVGKLKTLYVAATGDGDFGYDELLGFQEVAQTTLKESIQEMNDIIREIEMEFYGPGDGKGDQADP